jgi:hypothetical protein
VEGYKEKKYITDPVHECQCLREEGRFYIDAALVSAVQASFWCDDEGAIADKIVGTIGGVCIKPTMEIIRT